MRRLWWFLALAGCVPEHGESSMGPGGPVSPLPVAHAADAGIDASPLVPGRIRGKLCVTRDFRPLSTCEAIHNVAASISVRETGASAVIADDGTFDMPGLPDHARVTLVMSDDDPTWAASAVTVPLAELGSAFVRIPTLSRAELTELALANLANLGSNTGVLVVHVRDALRAPLAGATLSSIGDVAPLYDEGDPLVLSAEGPTDETGTAVYFGLPPGDVDVTLTAGARSVEREEPVVAGRVTFTDEAF